MDWPGQDAQGERRSGRDPNVANNHFSLPRCLRDGTGASIKREYAPFATDRFEYAKIYVKYNYNLI